MKKPNKTVVARIVAIVLVAMMIFGTFAAAIPALTTRTSAAGNTIRETLYFPKFDIVFNKRTIPAGRIYEIPKDGELLIEKGATLTIYGSLIVSGTIKNEGTIIIATGPVSADSPEEISPGYLANQEKIINKGKIRVVNGSITNGSRAVFENQGELIIEDTYETSTQFTNLSRMRDKKYLEQGVVNNTGTIRILSTKNVGINNQKDAIFNNEGTLEQAIHARIVGTISGKKVSTFIPEDVLNTDIIK